MRKKKKREKGKVKIDVQNKRMRLNLTNGCVNFSYDIHSKVDRVLRCKGSKKIISLKQIFHEGNKILGMEFKK